MKEGVKGIVQQFVKYTVLTCVFFQSQSQMRRLIIFLHFLWSLKCFWDLVVQIYWSNKLNNFYIIIKSHIVCLVDF